MKLLQSIRRAIAGKPEQKTTQLAATRPRTGRLFSDFAVGQLMDAIIAQVDADQVLRAMGKTRAELRKLEYDVEISAALETRLNALLATPWHLDDTGIGAERIDWLRKQIVPLMEPIITGAWHAVPYGYAVQEVIYRREDDGRIGLARVTEKPFEWFQPTRDDQLYLLQHNGRKVRVNIDIKFLLTRRNPSWNQPYGEALLSRLWHPWFFRYNGWRFWMQFVERFGEPLIVGSTIDTKKMVEEIQALGYEAVIAVPEGSQVEIMKPNGDGHQALIQELTKQVNKLILGQTLTSDVGATGSYAAAKVHNEVRADRRDADARLVARTVQTLINALWLLNGFDGTPPAFGFDTENKAVTPDQAEAYAKLKAAGVRLTEQYLLREHDFIEGDFEIEQCQPVPQSGALATGRPPLALAAGHGSAFTPAQQQVEALVDTATSEAPQPVSEERLRQLVAQAKSPEHLDELLAAEAAEADPAAYRELLERALFAADVLGYVKASQREV